MDTYKDAVDAQRPVGAGDAPWRVWERERRRCAGWAPSRWSPGGRGLHRRVAREALLERGDDVVSFDRERPRAPGSALGPARDRGRVSRSDGRPARRRARRGGSSRARGRHASSTSPRETIVGTVAESPVRGLRDQRARDLDRARGLPRAGVERVVVRLVGQGLRRPRRAALPRGLRAPADRAVRGLEGGGRPDRAQLLARRYGLPVAVTRFANVYGGGDLNFSRLVPEAVCAALDGRAPVLRSDGSPERDFLYVEDAASRLPGDRRRARPRRGPRRGVQRRRRRAAIAVGEVVAMIARLAGTGVEPEIRGDGQPRGRDRPPVRRPDQAARADGLAPGSSSRTGWRRRSTGTASTREARAPAPDWRWRAG